MSFLSHFEVRLQKFRLKVLNMNDATARTARKIMITSRTNLFPVPAKAEHPLIKKAAKNTIRIFNILIM